MKFVLLVVFFATISITSLAQIQIGSDIDGEYEDDRSGTSVSLSANGNTVAIGAPSNGDKGWGYEPGHVRVYQFIDTSWIQLGSDIDGEGEYDNSGTSVSLSADGSIVAIGAAANSDSGKEAGHVRIYQFIDTSWVQMGSDIDGDEARDWNGYSVSLSADGSIVAIGAPKDGDGSHIGRVRIFKFIGSSWHQLGYDIDGEEGGDWMGSSVSLSADGSIVAIGAHWNDGNGYWSGHVRIHKFNGTSWVQLGSDIDGHPESWSGYSVSLSADGSVVATGAPVSVNNGYEVGQVRIYQYMDTSWVQLGSDINGEVGYASFGHSVSLSANGEIIAIGSPNNGFGGTGQVRLYRYNGSFWEQLGEDINGESHTNNSGYSVSLSADGSLVAIGAPVNSNDNGDFSGHVRVMKLDNAGIHGSLISFYPITVYPNPATSEINVTIDPREIGSCYSIWSHLGSKVMKGVLGGTSNTIQINSLSKGVYFLYIDESMVQSFRIMVK